MFLQNFPVDITSYLEDAGNVHGEKILTAVFGMDCVPHEDIIPYQTNDPEPISHDLFHGFYEPSMEKNDGCFFWKILRKVYSSNFELFDAEIPRTFLK